MILLDDHGSWIMIINTPSLDTITTFPIFVLNLRSI